MVVSERSNFHRLNRKAPFIGFWPFVNFDKIVFSQFFMKLKTTLSVKNGQTLKSLFLGNLFDFAFIIVRPRLVSGRWLSEILSHLNQRLTPS